MDLVNVPSQTIVDDVAKGVKVVGAIASVEEKVMPYAMLVAGLFPGAASVLAAIAIAQPYIDKVAQYAPTVAAYVEKGVPVVDAIKQHAPEVIDHLKSAYATLKGIEPNFANITADDVSETVAIEFFKTLAGNNFFTPRDPLFDRMNPVT